MLLSRIRDSNVTRHLQYLRYCNYSSGRSPSSIQVRTDILPLACIFRRTPSLYKRHSKTHHLHFISGLAHKAHHHQIHLIPNRRAQSRGLLISRATYRSQVNILLSKLLSEALEALKAIVKSSDDPASAPSAPHQSAVTIELAQKTLIDLGYDPTSFWEQPIVWGFHDAFQ
jgi:hypothetical protein